MYIPLPYFVYILLSEKDKLLYIGYTSNLERRFSQHQNGESKSTAPRRPFEEDARRREMYFKTSMGKKAIKLMLSGTFKKLGYKQGGNEKMDILFDSEDLR